MHLQCSRMPAKVYNELSRRCGTRNVLINKDIGMDLLRGCGGGGEGTPLALARGIAWGCAIFHDKSKNY